jgi:hypothetical protein
MAQTRPHRPTSKSCAAADFGKADAVFRPERVAESDFHESIANMSMTRVRRHEADRDLLSNQKRCLQRDSQVSSWRSNLQRLVAEADRLVTFACGLPKRLDLFDLDLATTVTDDAGLLESVSGN